MIAKTADPRDSASYCSLLRFSLDCSLFRFSLDLHFIRCESSLVDCNSQARSPCDDIVARPFRICTYTTKLSTPNAACFFDIYDRLNPVYIPCRGRSSDQEVQELAHNLTDRIASNSEACTSFTEHLDASSRHQLILALAASQPALSPSHKQKLDLLLQEHHVAPPYDQLSKWALDYYFHIQNFFCESDFFCDMSLILSESMTLHCMNLRNRTFRCWSRFVLRAFAKTSWSEIHSAPSPTWLGCK